MSHSKDRRFLIYCKGLKTLRGLSCWHPTAGGKCPKADLARQNLTPLVPSQEDEPTPVSPAGFSGKGDFALRWTRGAQALHSGLGSVNLLRGEAAKSLGQKAPAFWRMNMLESHVRIITAVSRCLI